MQVMGGYGYTQEYKIERFLRDAKLNEIGGGTLEYAGFLANTNDADFIVLPFDELTGQMIHDALSEGRNFHQRHGYYADAPS